MTERVGQDGQPSAFRGTGRCLPFPAGTAGHARLHRLAIGAQDGILPHGTLSTREG